MFQKTHLDSIMHEQTIICTRSCDKLPAGEKEGENASNDNCFLIALAPVISILFSSNSISSSSICVH